MKTLLSGAGDFPFVRTDVIDYEWKFEDAGDHEHPYILTVTVAGKSHSEGVEHLWDEAEAAANAERLAQETYAASQHRK